MRSKNPYQAYVIRLWPTSRHSRADCRVLVEEVATRARVEFADLNSLFDYLRSQADLLGTCQVAAAETGVFREGKQG